MTITTVHQCMRLRAEGANDSASYNHTLEEELSYSNNVSPTRQAKSDTAVFATALTTTGNRAVALKIACVL